MYSNWSGLVKSTDLNRLLYWVTPGLLTLTVTMSPTISVQVPQSHGHTSCSEFRFVNIYRCQSNGASDTNLSSPGKNVVWCWEQSPNFPYRKRGWHIYETKLHTHKLCNRAGTVFYLYIAIFTGVIWYRYHLLSYHYGRSRFMYVFAVTIEFCWWSYFREKILPKV